MSALTVRLPTMTDLITSYFIRKRWVDLSLEHAKAATFCFRYLTSKPFMRSTEDDQILLYAKKGYYAFQDYSVQYCLDHFQKSVGPSSSDTTQMMRSTSESARDFLKSYSLRTGLQGSEAGFSQEEVIQFMNELPNNSRDRDQCFDIAYRTVIIRRQIEELRSQALTAEELDIVNNLYGFETKFKCPKMWCNHFNTGFATRKELTKHLDCHERPFCCPEEGCFASHFGFDAEEKLHQHTVRHHPTQSAEVRFPKKPGRRKFSRREALALSRAAAKGDVTAVLEFLDSGVDPNFQSESGIDPNVPSASLEPLKVAADFGHFEVCKLLLERGAKLVQETAGASDIMTLPLYSALHGGQLDMIHLFLCQPELRSSRALKKLSGWIAAACHHDSADVLKLLLESPISRHINVQEFDLQARMSITNTCLTRASVEPLRYLLENGFSELFVPDVLFLAETRGREDFVGLLRPVIDKTHPPYSMPRAESLLNYLGVELSSLNDGQITMLQNLSPDEQRKAVMEYKIGLGQLERKAGDELLFSVLWKLRHSESSET